MIMLVPGVAPTGVAVNVHCSRPGKGRHVVQVMNTATLDSDSIMICHMPCSHGPDLLPQHVLAWV